MTVFFLGFYGMNSAFRIAWCWPLIQTCPDLTCLGLPLAQLCVSRLLGAEHLSRLAQTSHA